MTEIVDFTDDELQKMEELYQKILDTCESYKDKLDLECMAKVLCKLAVSFCVTMTETEHLYGMALHQKWSNDYLIEWIRSDKDNFEKFITAEKF